MMTNQPLLETIRNLLLNNLKVTDVDGIVFKDYNQLGCNGAQKMKPNITRLLSGLTSEKSGMAREKT